jgi:hypothetical protein
MVRHLMASSRGAQGLCTECAEPWSRRRPSPAPQKACPPAGARATLGDPSGAAVVEEPHSDDGRRRRSGASPSIRCCPRSQRGQEKGIRLKQGNSDATGSKQVNNHKKRTGERRRAEPNPHHGCRPRSFSAKESCSRGELGQGKIELDTAAPRRYPTP